MIDKEERERKRKELAERNRQLLPGVSKIVDQVREVFGPDVKLIYGQDKSTGYEIGRPTEDGPIRPDDMIPRRIKE